MNRLSLSTIAIAAFIITACSNKNDTSQIIGKPDVKVENGRFTPEVMWGLGKMGEMSLSPDGTQMAYTVTYYDMKQNRGNAEIYLQATDGGVATRLTNSNQSEQNLCWLSNSELAYVVDGRIVLHDIKSGKITPLCDPIEGLEGFRISSDHSSVVYIVAKPVQRPADLAPLFDGLDQTTGRINQDLMYRHWDTWVDDLPHIYIASIQNGKIDTGTACDILDGEPYECPMRPMGGIEQYTISPDSKTVAYTCRKKTGMDYALSTNSDIYLYDIATGTTRNISEPNGGYDINPVFSHNGKYVAWESMERDGYESDKSRLMVMNLASGERTDLTANFDYSVAQLVWGDNDDEVFAIVMYRGMQEVFAFNVSNGNVRQLTHGYHNINAFTIWNDNIYAQQVSLQYPAEIYTYHVSDSCAEGVKFTAINDDVLSQVRMGKIEEHWIKTTDGKEMLTWLVYPYDYDSTKTYPALLYCEGGPQSMVGQFWSTRWNMEIMSGAGYFVIAPNRRGCPGFGTQWCEAISGDYGGQCMSDLLTAADYFSSHVKAIDADRMGACGASFGAFTVYWLAGHNENHRFKALLAHNGMFNLEQQYLETEELWFTNWDLGGPFWEKDNPRVRKSYAQSPHLFVDKWNAPLCVIHSEHDYRIVASQGMAAYNAAKLRGLDARYLYFPDETHWVLRPQNSLLWHRNFIDWFDRHLK